MADDLKMYRIFLSSPAGLEEERGFVRKFVSDYNKIEGYRCKVHFCVECWEDFASTCRRPQDSINEVLRQCDYFVLLLWDRWGTPRGTGQHGAYSSGCEEEFEVARNHHRDAACAMADIAVYFKAVEESRLRSLDADGQLAEKDEQLKKVMEFKKKLGQSNALFYQEFRDTTELQTRIWANLAKWKHVHEDRLVPVGVKSVLDVAELPD